MHKDDVAAFTLGAGQGKTFLALLLAQYHSSQDKRVMIVVPSYILKQQFETYVNKFLDKNVLVVEPKNLYYKEKVDVFICDEADLLLEKHAVFVK